MLIENNIKDLKKKKKGKQTEKNPSAIKENLFPPKLFFFFLNIYLSIHHCYANADPLITLYIPSSSYR